ncbi:hypothetical protein [Actinomadura violacea]|uniref:Uncharacterized protein n=1 Tax=Actinomadura violacea TaxID=2819934 RepID=A0ABS3RY74_9ACTN|nr:hypothetical protein [Actinomadura violacea]MBO2461711.1 hypothetical protein [Actinomadura violacea]
MSREVKRVPVDFVWPLDQRWQGYLTPDHLLPDSCPDCEHGLSPSGEYLFDLWHGKIPFHPAVTGSTLLTPATPQVRALAELHIAQAPDYYGADEFAICREAARLGALFNSMWCHHLAQEDVDALVAAGRLTELTHDRGAGGGWQPKDPPAALTAEQVNAWSLRGMGHDSMNARVVIKARCVREGVAYACATCGGDGHVEAYPGQRAEAKAWRPTEPPAGDGWQLWESVTEGAPITPVFETADDLVAHLVAEEGFRPGAAKTLVEQGRTAGSICTAGGAVLHSALDADVINAVGADRKKGIG